MGTVEFSRLIGLKASLYYRSHMNQFQLGDVIFEVLEDESDGYRSYMKAVQIVDQNAKRKEGDLLAEIIIQIASNSNFDGFDLVDTHDGHTWLSFGTDNSDDYYPSFTFYFQPKDRLKEVTFAATNNNTVVKN